MADATEAAVRLGLALYQKTILHGLGFYSIYDLVYDESAGDEPRALFRGTFSRKDNFWGVQAEAARVLDGAGLAQSQRRQVQGSGVADYWLRITPLGKSVYAIAYLQSDPSNSQIDGLTVEDVATVLANQESAETLARELRGLDDDLDSLSLSNFQRATVNSYIGMLTIICDMPERDSKLFWIILERLNQFSGVASLVVALIALKLAQ